MGGQEETELHFIISMREEKRRAPIITHSFVSYEREGGKGYAKKSRGGEEKETLPCYYFHPHEGKRKKEKKENRRTRHHGYLRKERKRSRKEKPFHSLSAEGGERKKAEEKTTKTAFHTSGSQRGEGTNQIKRQGKKELLPLFTGPKKRRGNAAKKSLVKFPDQQQRREERRQKGHQLSCFRGREKKEEARNPF